MVTSDRSAGCRSLPGGRRGSGCWRGRRRWAMTAGGRWSPLTGSASCSPNSCSLLARTSSDVPPTLSARVRLLGATKASKNDPNDALATAIAGLRQCRLRTVRLEDHAAVVRMVVDRYDDLTRLRTQAAFRLHAVMRELALAGHPRPSRRLVHASSSDPCAPSGSRRSNASDSPANSWPTY